MTVVNDDNNQIDILFETISDLTSSVTNSEGFLGRNFLLPEKIYKHRN